MSGQVETWKNCGGLEERLTAPWNSSEIINGVQTKDISFPGETPPYPAPIQDLLEFHKPDLAPPNGKEGNVTRILCILAGTGCTTLVYNKFRDMGEMWVTLPAGQEKHCPFPLIAV